MNLNRLFILLIPIISSCASNQEQLFSACIQGTTKLDGVCVQQGIANYVGCVRAQGANLETKQSHSLSTTVGKIAINASAASDVSTLLKNKYTASDKAMLAIINQCNKLSGIEAKHIQKKDIPDQNNISSTPNIYGAWKINANGYTGKLEFADLNGMLMGKVWFDAHKRWEKLSNFNLDGNTIQFSRGHQRYTAEYSNSKLIGRFTTLGRSYDWAAIR